MDKEDVPEFDGDLTRNVNAVDGWKNAVGLAGFGATSNEDEAPETIPMKGLFIMQLIFKDCDYE